MFLGTRVWGVENTVKNQKILIVGWSLGRRRTGFEGGGGECLTLKELQEAATESGQLATTSSSRLVTSVYVQSVLFKTTILQFRVRHTTATLSLRMPS